MAQNKKVAILETVDKVGDVPYGIKLQVRSSLTFAISNTDGYEGFDRADIASIVSEQSFQRTGMVSESQIKKLGEMTGAEYVLIAEVAVYDSQNFIITAKLLDVETAGVIKSAPPTITTKEPKQMQEACNSLTSSLFDKKGKAISSISVHKNEEDKDSSDKNKQNEGWNLVGRTPISLPAPSNDFTEAGKVVVAVIVSANGKVVSAKIADGTTVSDARTQQLALKAAYKAVFTPTDHPDKQFGTITYIFKWK